MVWLPDAEKQVWELLCITVLTNAGVWRTDRQTDILQRHNPRYVYTRRAAIILITCQFKMQDEVVACIISSANKAEVMWSFWLSLSLYCMDFFGRKINLSGISPAKRSRSGPNSVFVDTSRGWQRSGNFGHDRPILGKCPAEREFFSVCINPDDLFGNFATADFQ